MAIRQVVFDVGGVLVDWHARRTLTELYGAERADRLMAAVFNTRYWQEQIDLGLVTTGQILDRLAREHGEMAREIRAIEGQMLRFMPPFPEVLPLIDRLEGAGCGLYYLSNYAWEPFSQMLRTYPVFQKVREGIVSSRVHTVKPDPAIYRILLQTYHLDPGECVFVDDHPGNLEPARKLGFSVIQYVGAEDLERRLTALGVL